MLDFVISLTLFVLVILFLPFAFVIYFVLKLVNTIWFNCVSLLHPNVQFLKTYSVRTLLDTHRNQGIISVLLCVRGHAQPEAVRRHLQEVVNRRGKTGNLAFPRLQECLVTRCGNYAWEKRNFDLDLNLTVTSANFKGRTISDYNVQECVSDIISKYLPVNTPPWQVIIIPTSEDHHYILLKLHHVLLGEGLNIGDLLPLIPPTRQNSGYFIPKSPLVHVLKTPTAIPYFKEKLTEEITNHWNEFVANFDPLERIELLKNTPSFFQFLAISLITFVSILKECRRGVRVIKNDIFSKIKFITYTINRETSKRQVCLSILVQSILFTINPINLIPFALKKVWFGILACTVQLPVTIYGEMVALYTCLTLQYCVYPNTCVGIIYNYIPLFYNALKELLYCTSLIFYAPKNIFDEILHQEETFQTVTLCGRKSVAWSDPIKISLIKIISKNTGVSETEVLLSAVSYGLAKYFTQTNNPIPASLPIILRNVNSNYIFATGTNIKPEDSMSGIICMSLPILNAEKDTTLLENLLKIKNQFNHSLEKQGVSHFLTILQTKYGFLSKLLPPTVISIYLKYLSRKFAISVTEVTSRYQNVTQRTLWGQEVDNLVYWRPPQANTCISLCLNEYSDHIKLGVMCDAQLAPNHSYLVNQFNLHFQDLGKAIGLE